MTTILRAQALLFDMDGTLVDSTAAVRRTWWRFASRHGLDGDEILAAAQGRRTIETVAMFAPSGTDVDAETAWLVSQDETDTDGVTAVPGARELLAALPSHRWALVTSAGRALAAGRMAAAGLPLPPVVVSADDVEHGKPHPEGYRAAAHALAVSTRSSVVFEDTEAGLRAAHAAGALPVAVGDHDAPTVHGPHRIPDLSLVGVEDLGEDGLRLRLPASSAHSTAPPAMPVPTEGTS
ncbi:MULTISPECIES: HAD-IA family hydrolase [unclassified Nocardiopsis]|uniref:HAD-IA family hydrolase n=1 Tax=unclassified Nocardiopsis TaxID=2649073 RepID=UPI000938A558|nr:HAD-IA family hydrolase [Nocardiopsis sp. TSRI0078]